MWKKRWEKKVHCVNCKLYTLWDKKPLANGIFIINQCTGTRRNTFGCVIEMPNNNQITRYFTQTFQFRAFLFVALVVVIVLKLNFQIQPKTFQFGCSCELTRPPHSRNYRSKTKSIFGWKHRKIIHVNLFDWVTTTTTKWQRCDLVNVNWSKNIEL